MIPLIKSLSRYWSSIPRVVRHNFILDFHSAIFYGVFLAGVITFVPIIARRLGASPLELALITAMQAIGNLIALAASHYLQHRRRLPFMVVAWSIGRGLFLLTPLVVTPEPLVLIVVAHWVLVSLCVTGYVEVVSGIYPTEIRGRAMAYVRVGFTACATLLTPLFGQWLDVWGYQTLFPLAALFGVLSGITFGRVKYQEIQTPVSQDWLAPLRVLVRDTRYRVYSIGFSLYGAGMLMISPIIPLLLVDELNLSNAQVGWLGMVNSVAWMLFYLVWGRSIDHRGGLWTVQINFLLTLVVPLAFFFAQDLWLLALAQIFLGITVAGTDLGWMNAIMQFARKEDIGVYTASHAFLVGLRGIVAPFLGTVLMTLPWIGLRGVFLIAVLLILTSWLIVRTVSINKPAFGH